MIVKLLILFSSLHCSLVLANPQILRPLIVGGTTIPVSSAPWQISLQRNGLHYCGGSIYSTYIIITAAHCLINASGWVLKIRAGSTKWNSGGVLIPVAAFKINENFESSTYVNDIAVIRLSSPLMYSANIQNISLASSTPANGAPASVSGWGTTYSGATTSPTSLQSVNVTIVGRSQCSSETYGFGSKIKPTMICAADDGKDACQGDSGGPLVSGGVLVGIVSWGVDCADAEYPGVYSDVATLRSWAVNASSSV